MKPIKILAIAPYSELRNLISTMAKDYSILDVHAYTADMYDGQALAKELQPNNFDIILSRAGTVELIREVSVVPVIDLRLSVLDMTRAIKLAQGYSGNFAIVGYNTITTIAKQICELFQFDIVIKTINKVEDIDNVLLDLKKQNITLIVGDVITTTHAKKAGLNTVLITTGQESIIQAFEEAIAYFDAYQKMFSVNEVFKSILENVYTSLICFNQKNTIIYSNLKEDIVSFKLMISDLIETNTTLKKNKKIKIIKQYGDTCFLINGIILHQEHEEFYCYYINYQTKSIKSLDNAVQFSNINDYPQINVDTFQSSSKVFQRLISDAQAYARHKSPILIIGERGTGKDAVAHTIYQNVINHKNPFITLDTRYVSEKKWLELFESEESIFLNSNLTIYIKNIHLMSDICQKIFELYLLETDFYKRNKLILSMVPSYSKFDDSPLLYFIKNRIHALPLILPTLNERREDIPSLVSLYLNELNPLYNKHVIGFKDNGLDLIKEFDWKDNIDQLKRVIRNLIIFTKQSYITYDTVHKVLKDESPNASVLNYYDIDLSKTLEEITDDIIKIVLKNKNYNFTKTAHQLGISRSTLWRRLKNK